MKQLSQNLIEIVSSLMVNEYTDGNAIGQRLGLTRAAVWKQIKKLQNYGVGIVCVKGRGYRLLEPLTLLDKRKIQWALGNTLLEIDVFESMASTNDYLKSTPANNSIKVCLAEQQTQGKGRLQRKWYSPFAQNLYFSCLYRMNKDISELAGLSLVVGLTICKTLREFAPREAFYVKWPNDVLYNDRKISGSLIEIQAESHGSCHAIIGVGINLNMQHTKGHRLNCQWSSLKEILGKAIDRNAFCAQLITHFLDDLSKFTADGFACFIGEWNRLDCLLGKTIIVKNAGEKIQGKVEGINAQGHLKLQLANGQQLTFSSGDTTILR